MEQYAELLFRRATGWLGWTPQAARRASIFDIELALDGRIEYLRWTVPGLAEAMDEQKAAVELTTPDGEINRPAVADRVRAMFGVKAP